MQHSTHCSAPLQTTRLRVFAFAVLRVSQSRTCSSTCGNFMLVVRPLKECNLRFFTWECAFPLFLLSFVRRTKAQERPQRKVHGMRCCIRCCGATNLVRTSFFFLCCSLTADVCVCLGPVEAAPPSFAISFCVEKQCSTRLFSTVVFSSCPPHSSGHQSP